MLLVASLLQARFRRKSAGRSADVTFGKTCSRQSSADRERSGPVLRGRQPVWYHDLESLAREQQPGTYVYLSPIDVSQCPRCEIRDNYSQQGVMRSRAYTFRRAWQASPLCSLSQGNRVVASAAGQDCIADNGGSYDDNQGEPFPFVMKVIDMFGDWLKQRRELKELMEYEAKFGEFESVAHELNVTPADLERLVRQESQSASELPYMLTALDIDEATLRRAEPALLRDIERVCSFCTHKRQCHQELAAGTAAMNYVEYCENADAIDMLRLKS